MLCEISQWHATCIVFAAVAGDLTDPTYRCLMELKLMRLIRRTCRPSPLACLAIAGLALALVAGPSQAVTINYTDLASGSTSGALPSGLGTYSTGYGRIAYKTVGSVTGAGIKDGYVSGEIDGKGPEYIKFTFTTPQYVESLLLAFLYPSGQFGDAVNEAARLVVGAPGGGSTTYWLTATGFTSCTWTGTGSCSNVVAAKAPAGALWRLDNPFAGPISWLTLTVASSGSSSKSDYSFVSMAVPEPGALAILGIGLLGGGIARRRRR